MLLACIHVFFGGTQHIVFLLLIEQLIQWNAAVLGARNADSHLRLIIIIMRVMLVDPIFAPQSVSSLKVMLAETAVATTQNTQSHGTATPVLLPTGCFKILET